MNQGLLWEPLNRTPLEEIAGKLKKYLAGRKNGASILQNGTVLFVTSDGNDVADAKTIMQESKNLKDFRVVRMKDGGYFVILHDAVSVFVGQEEFNEMRNEIENRAAELTLSGEVFLGGDSEREHYLVGLYGRGKLYRDTRNFGFYKRIEPT